MRPQPKPMLPFVAHSRLNQRDRKPSTFPHPAEQEPAPFTRPVFPVVTIHQLRVCHSRADTRDLQPNPPKFP
eukprot:1909737-Rhodomonas_salina.1